jgi:CDP-diacylglycerol---serine O-phosphatidyltransferase
MLNLPNIITLTNLFLGCCAILCILHGQPEAAAWCTLGSFLCDYADGMVARALKISGPLGKQLDSLADVISFGAVPGMMLYQMIASRSGTDYADKNMVVWQALPAFVLSAFSGLRLAKFNIDTRQTTFFMGLSTPACTIFVLGLFLGAHHNHYGFGDWIGQNIWLIYGLIPILCYLLVCEIPMFGLKINRLDFKSNQRSIGFFILLCLSAAWFKALALPLMIVIYIVTSIISKNQIVNNTEQK